MKKKNYEELKKNKKRIINKRNKRGNVKKYKLKGKVKNMFKVSLNLGPWPHNGF